MKLSEWIREEELEVRAMVVLKNEKLIFEWFAGGVSREHNHNVFSVTKSVVATMAGIAVGEQKLGGLNTTLKAHFSTGAKPEISEITVRNLLMMQSGFPISRGNQKNGAERELFDRLNAAPDRTEAALKLSLSTRPGKTFAYNNIDPQLMLSLIESAYGEKALNLANKRLFKPMGFKNVEWLYADKVGAVPGGYGLRLRAIDLAKFGQLYLQGGLWKGDQILPDTFVREATADQTGAGYGYYWWVSQRENAPGAFSAKGVRGQLVFIDPARELVFVVAADLPPAEVKPLLKAMVTGVLGAIADKPLADDVTKFGALQRELKIAARYVTSQRVNAPRARLPRISGER